MERKVIVFVGDSLTQYGFNTETRGFVAAIADWYERRADVFNRGFSGYNTTMILDVLSKVLSGIPSRVDLFILCLGANDAKLPNCELDQHVPLNRFKENLGKIVDVLAAYKCSKIILMTPPNVDPSREAFRTPEVTRSYADAALAVGAEKDVPCVRLFDKIGADGLVDGLHLNARGNDAVSAALKETIKSRVPEMAPAQLQMHLPDWKTLV
eukprot:Plantae.Rhodophyta-Purpureofilum_apyrenoidigerum.ctg37877.p1 GENE.Plantae.Rhodophyta-Purpureofilum_apyrenoidigerum.ctg37877~~Plantae.Rhodophyta-Purpureofilum_apyrenoidigerum.ctg37877.p1  ORF type:complete len:211 (-),score=45.86 Plantae.Rhodophyta-Purpureofilum_apyrenoidigerum.ctg37877:135-767(-)